jgi:septal ring factor EnvC (AmiA/AmiB activator)
MKKRISYYGYCLIIVYLVFSITNIKGQNRNKLEAKKLETLKEIEFTTKLIEETKLKSENSLHELNLIEHQIQIKNKLISTIEEELNYLEDQITSNILNINEIQEQEKKIKNNYAKSIYLAYRNRSKNYLILYIIASKNINQAYKRFRYIQIINRYRKRQIILLNELEKKKEKENIELKELKDNKEKLFKEYEKEKESLSKEKENKNSLFKKLKIKEKELKTDLEKKQKIAKQIDNEIQRIIKEEKKKSIKVNGIESLTAEEKIISNEFEKNYGRLPWPTKQGIVIGKFGEQEHPYLKGIKVRNDGIYIATVKNAEVRTIFKGIVTKIFAVPGSNYSVLIKHGSYYTLYHNLKEVKVYIGKNVNIKEVIGVVSTEPDKNESILYFQIWKETERNDPELWLAK